MIDAALHSGVADRRASFEVFTRCLPTRRRYGVVAGTGRVLEAIAAFHFAPDDIAYLSELGVSPATLKWLDTYEFRGDLWGYPEGEIYGAWSPLLTVEATFAEAVVLETVILSIMNHDAAVAAAASRMVTAAAGRRTIEMGSRRTDPDAAIGAARAAAIAGIQATSNLAAGKRYGLTTAGTAAHAFTMAHLDEPTAFDAQIAAQGVSTTLLVDTYDIPNGLRNAVMAAQRFGSSGPGGVRIDSGDLVAETKRARATLDVLGALDTKIVVSGDLDEYRMHELISAGAPIDVFGVGTSLVMGSGAPTAALTYKLVAIEGVNGLMHGVAKRSAGKVGAAGRKTVHRVVANDGQIAERLVVGDPLESSNVQVQLISRGAMIANGSPKETAVAMVKDAAQRHVRVRTLLDQTNGLTLEPGEAVIHGVIEHRSTDTAQTAPETDSVRVSR